MRTLPIIAALEEASGPLNPDVNAGYDDQPPAQRLGDGPNPGQSLADGPQAAPAPAKDGYDQLLDLTDSVPGVDTFMTVVSQILNGGVQQLADNERGDEVQQTIDWLFNLSAGRNARTFAKFLTSCQASLAAYAAAQYKRDEWGNQNEDDVSDQFFGEGSIADTFEDWLYDTTNSEALYAEVLAAVQS